MSQFSFDHLSDVEFEELSFDLLVSLGAEKVNWRKGTGLNASPADQGRDIECYFEHVDCSREKVIERWFVECKHHKKGVSPDKLLGALSWAQAEQPDCLLIIASNFLSNPTKAYLESFKQNNKPKFKIKIWELKDLERLSIGKPALLRKYKIGDDFPFLKLLHPAHIMFLREPPMSTLDRFFGHLEKAGLEQLDGLGLTYLHILNCDVKEPDDLERQTLRELLTETVSYATFRKKCYELQKVVSDQFLIQAIINDMLKWLFHYGDTTNEEKIIANNKGMIITMEKMAVNDQREAALVKRSIEATRKRIQELPTQTARHYQDYICFCEKVVAPLFWEEFEVSQGTLKQLEDFIGKHQ